MTVTIALAWWAAPVGILAAGLLLAAFFASRAKAWDLANPIIAVCCAVGGAFAALAFCLGHWLA